MTTTYQRRAFGYLRADGEAFLERGAPMSDTGHPAWIVWIRALDSEISVDEFGATSGNADPVRTLREITLDDDEPETYFIHRGDEGWLADAKSAAIVHLERRDSRAATAKEATR